MLGKWSWFISSEFKFTLIWQVSWFMNLGVILWQAWNRSLHKVWETIMNNQRRCGRMCKITEHWLNTAAFGHMEHYNISNVAPTMWLGQDVWTQHISPTSVRAQTNLQTYLKDGLSQVSVQLGYCLFWMMHTTLSITQLYESPIRAVKTPYCQETTQPIGVPSYITMEMCVLITMTHHFSNIFLVVLC